MDAVETKEVEERLATLHEQGWRKEVHEILALLIDVTLVADDGDGNAIAGGIAIARDLLASAQEKRANMLPAETIFRFIKQDDAIWYARYMGFVDERLFQVKGFLEKAEDLLSDGDLPGISDDDERVVPYGK